MTSAFEEIANAFMRSDLLKIVRYFIAGVAVSLGYTITVVALVEWLDWESPTLANAASFILWTPVSYYAHRGFTFRYQGTYTASSIKFGITTVARLLASMAVVAATVNYFQMHYIIGVLMNWIVLPLITFVILKLWVYRPTSAQTE